MQKLPPQIFDQVFDQVFGQGFDQGFGEGKSHKYSVQYYTAWGKPIENNQKREQTSKTITPSTPLNLLKTYFKGPSPPISPSKALLASWNM